MPERQRVSFTVEVEKLEAWDEHVGDGGRFVRRSDMVRTAVDDYLGLREEYTDATNTESSGLDRDTINDLADDVSELDEKTDEIISAIGDLSQAIQQMGHQAEEHQLETGEVDLRRAVSAVIPTEESVPEGRDGLSGSEIARRIGGDPEEVLDVLSSLHENNPRIEARREILQTPEGGDEHTVYIRRGGER